MSPHFFKKKITEKQTIGNTSETEKKGLEKSQYVAVQGLS